jgi:integrase
MDATLILMSHGLRFGEIFGLTWDQFDKNEALICRQLKKVPRPVGSGERSANVHALIPRKCHGESYRVRFSDGEMDVLFKANEVGASTTIWIGKKSGDNWIGAYHENIQFVVPGLDGKPSCETSFRRHFKKLIKDAGIQHVTPHAFRAWMATTLLDAKVPVKHVQMALGHGRVETTLLYDRPNPERGIETHDYVSAMREGLNLKMSLEKNS